jgi:hypothetical protein
MLPGSGGSEHLNYSFHARYLPGKTASYPKFGTQCNAEFSLYSSSLVSVKQSKSPPIRWVHNESWLDLCLVNGAGEAFRRLEVEKKRKEKKRIRKNKNKQKGKVLCSSLCGGLS